jgi:GrpB-like predicted nucleotidyltransferase (UPF0157 family)
MLGLRRGTVILSEHDSSWAEWFLQERDRLQPLLGQAVGPFEHVGSTAVPGLPAKPIIDFMAGVASIAVARALIPLLETQGYEYRPNGDLPGRILLVFGPPERREAHFSLVVRESDEWRNVIYFRDYLRAHPDALQEYAALKRDLAVKFTQDRPAYTAAKDTFIRKILAKSEHKTTEP